MSVFAFSWKFALEAKLSLKARSALQPSIAPRSWFNAKGTQVWLPQRMGMEDIGGLGGNSTSLAATRSAQPQRPQLNELFLFSGIDSTIQDTAPLSTRLFPGTQWTQELCYDKYVFLFCRVRQTLTPAVRLIPMFLWRKTGRQYAEKQSARLRPSWKNPR